MCWGEGSNLSIIGCSANAQDGDIKACTEAGMDDFIAKPVRFPVLESVVISNMKKVDQQSRSRALPPLRATQRFSMAGSASPAFSAPPGPSLDLALEPTEAASHYPRGVSQHGQTE